MAGGAGGAGITLPCASKGDTEVSRLYKPHARVETSMLSCVERDATFCALVSVESLWNSASAALYETMILARIDPNAYRTFPGKAASALVI